MLDEGVAVCSGMQAVAVNTSLCRLIGIEPQDAQHLMISSFIADADVIERLLGEGELRLDTDITNRAGDDHRGRDRGAHASRMATARRACSNSATSASASTRRSASRSSRITIRSPRCRTAS